jgi:hypothetical protein
MNSSVEIATARAIELRESGTSALDTEKALLAFLEWGLERGLKLIDCGVMTPEALDEMQSEVDATRCRLAHARLERQAAVPYGTRCERPPDWP